VSKLGTSAAVNQLGKCLGSKEKEEAIPSLEVVKDGVAIEKEKKCGSICESDTSDEKKNAATAEVLSHAPTASNVETPSNG
jgi:hypothetical protein